jgi:RimJ/RimL family protein N-acetyltransferase
MLFPHTETRRIALRPASAQDAPQAYDILFALGRGGLPMIDTFVDGFGRGMSACFMVHLKDDDAETAAGDVVGLTTLSEPTPAGHLRADVNLVAGQPNGVRTDAGALTVNFAFAMWRTRKVYLHTTDASVESTGFIGEHAPMVRAEAVLPDHTYFHGRLWDVHVFAIYREDWDVQGVDLLKQLV